MKQITLEICAGDIDSVKAAVAGGADRVELCSALGEGGVTPSLGFIAAAKNIRGIRVHVLIRPRGGDFIYTPDEVECMRSDIAMCRSLGVDGVVIGALTPGGDIDMEACKRLVDEADNMSITFHRAFDMAEDPDEALEDIISLGCDRLLTSGMAPTALDGIPTIMHLRERAEGRIRIMAGAGVSPATAPAILKAAAADDLHASARTKVTSPVKFRRESVKMGTPDADEFSRLTTSATIVRNLKDIITEYNIIH
ncbi:copper homeostasis protein CutC [Duncaniella freteri]|uniref:copper homeostasis protein CutC n=3 Tax=Duncaniella TaxID=2518495 RepID=UPI00255806FD|nr:copper homeostasis protein CutC [Duncaniella freteri]